MSTHRSRRALQGLIAAIGTVALVAGLGAMIFGISLVPGAGDPGASLDSELRFFAAWYAAVGVVLLKAVKRVETAATIVKGVAIVFFAAGCSRILSWIAVGRPHTLFVVLMALELTLPLVMVRWQSAVASRRA
jgi:hypothetical protein